MILKKLIISFFNYFYSFGQWYVKYSYGEANEEKFIGPFIWKTFAIKFAIKFINSNQNRFIYCEVIKIKNLKNKDIIKSVRIEQLINSLKLKKFIQSNKNRFF